MLAGDRDPTTAWSDLNALTADLVEIDRSLRTERLLVPLNAAEQRDATVAAARRGDFVNPQFMFEPVDTSVADLYDALAATIDPTASPWHEVLWTDATTSSRTLHAIATRDAERMTENSLYTHGRPSDDVIAAAQQILHGASGPPEHERGPIDASDAAEMLRHPLQALGLDHWTVTVDPVMNARMSVNSTNGVVRVRHGASFTEEEVRRLVVHEIGTHVVRGENGRRQPLHMLAFGLGGYMSTEEGLATWHEERFGVSSPEVMLRYACRVIAADMVLHHTFAEVFAALVPHIGVDAAYDICARAKRGFTDTSQPGGNTKDHVYLTGYLSVSALLSSSPELHTALLAGKISADHAPLTLSLIESGHLVAPALLPDAVVATLP